MKYPINCPDFKQKHMHLRSDLLHSIILQVIVQAQRREIAHFHLVWFHENTGLVWTAEVALATNAAVILACRLVQLDPHPDGKWARC